ncbi:MAG: hypothetical protein M3O32_06890 [Actinomycetota bacterium]|nr:hypothetical protein [Actinomycetota bacterium]
MSVVVERGLARCPRCVAVAAYAFVESGPNSVRYEVNCGKCGQAYCEVHTPVTPDFTAAVDALVVPPPVAAPTAMAVQRARVAAWFTGARTATSSAATRIALRLKGVRR